MMCTEALGKCGVTKLPLSIRFRAMFAGMIFTLLSECSGGDRVVTFTHGPVGGALSSPT